MLINDGKGHFTEKGLGTGIAHDGFGKVQGSMGVNVETGIEMGGWTCGHPYHRQIPILFENQKGLYFEDVSRKTGFLREPMRTSNGGWGCLISITMVTWTSSLHAAN